MLDGMICHGPLTGNNSLLTTWKPDIHPTMPTSLSCEILYDGGATDAHQETRIKPSTSRQAAEHRRCFTSRTRPGASRAVPNKPVGGSTVIPSSDQLDHRHTKPRHMMATQATERSGSTVIPDDMLKKSRQTSSRTTGHIKRRAWGAGPGAATSSTACRPKSGIRATAVNSPGKFSETCMVPRFSTPSIEVPDAPAVPAQEWEPTAAERLMPVWTSLVAEAPWLYASNGINIPRHDCGEALQASRTDTTPRGATTQTLDGTRLRPERGSPAYSGEAIDYAPARLIEAPGRRSTVVGTTRSRPGPPPGAPCSESQIPLLNPEVEKLLMEWIKVRVDRYDVRP